MSLNLNGKKVLATVVLATSFTSVSALAADCGEAPGVPALVDGATSTMEQLIANSKEVNGFIADADTYIDCVESDMKSRKYKKLSDAEKETHQAALTAILNSRNEIGDKFNVQVAAFKAANPE